MKTDNQFADLGIKSLTFEKHYTKTVEKDGEKNTEPCVLLYHLVTDWYAKDELDWGNWWDYGNGLVELHDEYNNVIASDIDDILGAFEMSAKEFSEKMEAIEEPGDFIEFQRTGPNYRKETIRVVAQAERPRICAANTFWDVGYAAANRILIYGKPLCDDCRLTGHNKFWRKDLKNWIVEMIAREIRDRDVIVSIDKSGIEYFEDDLCVTLDLLAPNENALDGVLKDLGAREIDKTMLSSAFTSGNEPMGFSRVHARISVSSRPRM